MIGIARNAGSALMRRVASYSVEDGQLNVHQDEVWPLLCNGGECLHSVLRLHDFVVCAGKQVTQDLPIIFLVLHNQYALGHVGLARC